MLTPDESGSYRHASDPGEPTTGQPRLSVTDLEADILAAIVVGCDVLEIGTGLGVSTRALAASARTVTTVDVDPWVHDNIWPDLPDNVTTATSVPSHPFSAAFIDGDHSTDAVARDLSAALQVVVGGPIVAHDTAYPFVRKGLLRVVPEGWRFIGTTHGIGVLWL